jgi:hypothetical protein
VLSLGCVCAGRRFVHGVDGARWQPGRQVLNRGEQVTAYGVLTDDSADGSLDENGARRGRVGVEARKRALHFHSHRARIACQTMATGYGCERCRWENLYSGVHTIPFSGALGTGLFQRSKGRESQWKFNRTNISPPDPRIKQFLPCGAPLTKLRTRHRRPIARALSICNPLVHDISCRDN